jgi:hypothetical protein
METKISTQSSAKDKKRKLPDEQVLEPRPKRNKNDMDTEM